MTIQSTSPCSSHHAETPAASQKPATQSSQQQPHDTVQLSAQAKKSLDGDHHGDSH